MLQENNLLLVELNAVPTTLVRYRLPAILIHCPRCHNHSPVFLLLLLLAFFFTYLSTYGIDSVAESIFVSQRILLSKWRLEPTTYGMTNQYSTNLAKRISKTIRNKFPCWNCIALTNVLPTCESARWF